MARNAAFDLLNANLTHAQPSSVALIIRKSGARIRFCLNVGGHAAKVLPMPSIRSNPLNNHLALD